MLSFGQPLRPVERQCITLFERAANFFPTQDLDFVKAFSFLHNQPIDENQELHEYRSAHEPHDQLEHRYETTTARKIWETWKTGEPNPA